MSANRFRFRTWDKEQNKMHYFTKLTVCDNCIMFDNPDFDLGDNHNDDASPILMQSTGLCDKNGKEIFEGDVFCIYCPYRVLRVVKWIDGVFWGCDPKANNPPCAPTNDYLEYDHPVTVIGNIYENPELLEAK